MNKRKIAELWLIDGNYHLLAIVSGFHVNLARGNQELAELAATYEIIESLRKIVAESDSKRIQIEKEIPHD